eukprot:7386925-Heterocapsa_arctica.AAC.1
MPLACAGEVPVGESSGAWRACNNASAAALSSKSGAEAKGSPSSLPTLLRRSGALPACAVSLPSLLDAGLLLTIQWNGDA